VLCEKSHRPEKNVFYKCKFSHRAVIRQNASKRRELDVGCGQSWNEKTLLQAFQATAGRPEGGKVM